MPALPGEIKRVPPLQRRLISAGVRTGRDLAALQEMLHGTPDAAWPRTVWPMLEPGALPPEVLDALMSDLTLRGSSFARPWLERLADMADHPLQGIAMFMLAYHFPPSAAAGPRADLPSAPLPV